MGLYLREWKVERQRGAKLLDGHISQASRVLPQFFGTGGDLKTFGFLSISSMEVLQSALPLSPRQTPMGEDGCRVELTVYQREASHVYKRHILRESITIAMTNYSP